MNEILINNQNVRIKEYEGERVITFKDIDMVHDRPEGTARRNFNTNKKHFIEGEDFYILASRTKFVRLVLQDHKVVHHSQLPLSLNPAILC